MSEPVGGSPVPRQSKSREGGRGVEDQSGVLVPEAVGESKPDVVEASGDGARTDQAPPLGLHVPLPTVPLGTKPHNGEEPIEALSEDEVADLINESWRVLKSLVMTGSAVLQSGTVLEPRTHELIDVIEKVSKLRPPKTKKSVVAGNWQPRESHRGQESQ